MMVSSGFQVGVHLGRKELVVSRKIFESDHHCSSRQWLVMPCQWSSVLGFDTSYGLVLGEVRSRYVFKDQLVVYLVVSLVRDWG